MNEASLSPERAINVEKCTGCGNCVNACPALFFTQREPAAIAECKAEGECIRCGQCVAVCAPDAIRHSGLERITYQPRRQDLMPTIEQVTELLSSRRSVRSFAKAKVERPVLEQIVSLSACAPSGHNSQSTRFSVIDDPDRLALVSRLTAQALLGVYRLLNNPVTRFIAWLMYGAKITSAAKIRDSLASVARSTLEGRDRILRGAKAVIVFYGDPLEVMPDINAQLALANATFAAQTLGVGSFYCGYTLSVQDRSKELREALGVPRGHEVFGVLALGYPRVKYAKTMMRRPEVSFN